MNIQSSFNKSLSVAAHLISMRQQYNVQAEKLAEKKEKATIQEQKARQTAEAEQKRKRKSRRFSSYVKEMPVEGVGLVKDLPKEHQKTIFSEYAKMPQREKTRIMNEMDKELQRRGTK